jgi:hypothetical protein
MRSALLSNTDLIGLALGIDPTFGRIHSGALVDAGSGSRCVKQVAQQTRIWRRALRQSAPMRHLLFERFASTPGNAQHIGATYGLQPQVVGVYRRWFKA